MTTDCCFISFGPGGRREPCRRAATWKGDGPFGELRVCGAHRKVLDRELRYDAGWFPLFSGCCPQRDATSHRKASGRRSISPLKR